MKKIYKKIRISLLCICFAPTEVLSDDRLKLPRDIKGIEILVAAGASYDNTADLGAKELMEFSPTFALMTDRFYVDVHTVSYRFYPSEDTILTIIGNQDPLPNESDIPAYLNIKSGESYDLGVIAEKQFGEYRLEAKVATDITGTHNGMLFELATGYDYNSDKSHFEVTLGTRYRNEKRNNYLYGVSTKESNSRLRSYEAEADLTVFLHANYTYEIYKNLGVTVGGTFESLSNTVKKSPRIKSNAQYKELELFAGLIWQFSIYD